MNDLIELPDEVTNIEFSKRIVDVEPMTGEGTLMWLCVLLDSCIDDGEWNRRVLGRGITQSEALEKAISIWNGD